MLFLKKFYYTAYKSICPLVVFVFYWSTIVLLRPVLGIPHNHILDVSLIVTPNSSLAGSTNELMS